MKQPVVIPVYCDMTTNGGGWIVFLRRQDGSQDFYLGWNDYKDGFGDLHGEFWLGNDFLSLLTSYDTQQLRIDLEDFEGETRFAKYSSFSVGPSHDQYRLNVSGYSGDANDSLINHHGFRFSAWNADHENSSKHCAQVYIGAWWFHDCFSSHLNGEYIPDGISPDHYYGIIWYNWKGSDTSLKAAKMMIKPVGSSK